jgi:hypothetical protein
LEDKDLKNIIKNKPKHNFMEASTKLKLQDKNEKKKMGIIPADGISVLIAR